MGERFSDNWRILAATFFSVVLIAGAYVLARNIESPSVAQASEETALLKAIASKDSDNDGLPDWEEALYGTSATTTDTFKLGMTDGEAVAKGLIVPKAISDLVIATSSPAGSQIVDPSLPPVPAAGTLTAAFAQSFFTLFMTAKENNGGGDLSESQMSDVASQTLNSLKAIVAAAPDYKSAKDLTVSGSGTDALISFAVNAEAIFAKHESKTAKSEILYLKDAVEKNDITALSNIALIEKAYRESAVGLAALSVPKELATDDLMLINTLMSISRITRDFTRMNDDPLTTILALQQYPQKILDLIDAFTHIGTVYKAAGISLPAGAPGASVVNLMQRIANKQAAKNKNHE